MLNFFNVFASFVIALAVSVMVIPAIIRVCRKLNLLSVTNGRSASLWRVPNLGGIAVFLGFILGITLTSTVYFIHESIYIFAGGLVMLFVGLNDDILPMMARKKLLLEVVIAAILIFWGDFRFTNLHGFMGIEAIPMFVSVLLTGFVFLLIINAINLVDGIDGLAAGLSIFSASVLGVWFFLSGNFAFSIISFSLAGGLSGFFFYNVYGKENKIMMGDTGSLVVGTIIAILIVQFNELNIDQTAPYAVYAAPAVSFGLLVYPLLDTLRVFLIRIIQNKSPFVADKNHTHHRLLALRMNHREATYWILGVNALFTFAVFYFQWLGIVRLMIFIVMVGGFYLLMPSFILSTKNRIAENDPYQQIILFNMRLKKPEKKEEMAVGLSKNRLPNIIVEQLRRISIW